MQPAGRDRVTAEQTFRAVDWWQASDFRGVFNQRREQTRTVTGVLGALIGDTFRNFDFTPIRPAATREAEIVNQTTGAARVALLREQVEVTSVQPASTLRSTANARTLTGYPIGLRAGDRVTLYEENGIVKYYTRDTPPAQTADGATVARIDEDVQTIKARVAVMSEMQTDIANVRTANAEVAARTAQESARADAQAQELTRLQRRLEEVQQATASKDVQIAQLRDDLLQVTRAHDTLAQKLEARINRLVPADVAPTVPSPKNGVVAAPTRGAAAKKKKKGQGGTR